MSTILESARLYLIAHPVFAAVVTHGGVFILGLIAYQFQQAREAAKAEGV